MLQKTVLRPRPCPREFVHAENTHKAQPIHKRQKQMWVFAKLALFHAFTLFLSP